MRISDWISDVCSSDLRAFTTGIRLKEIHSMIGLRTRHSFAQFLELQEPAVSIVLLGKYGVAHLSLTSSQLLSQLNNIARGLDDRTIMLALSEVVSTAGDLREIGRASCRYRVCQYV